MLVPGASKHKAADCTLRQYIRPVLYAFWCEGSQEAKQFIRDNVGVPEDVDWATIENYTRWLEQRKLGFDTFNYLFLFWWLGVFNGHFT